MITRAFIRQVIGLFLLMYIAISYADTAPLRIVSLTPALTDTVVELGGADLLVGMLDIGERKPETAHVASVGGYGQFSLEKLISLKPDLILIWPTAIPAAQQKRLVDLGFKVVESDPHTLDELADELAVIGEHIGRADQGKRLSQNMHAELAQLRAKYHRKEPIGVFYQLWDQPIYTIGKNQIITDALRVCGAENVFSDMDMPAPEVSVEGVLARNPQAIISSNQLQLNTWKNWSQLAAVKRNQLLLFNNEHLARPSFAMLDATKELCQLLNKK